MNNDAKVCIVTGGSSGIGAAIVARFCENGYRVFNLDIQVNENQTTAHYIHCDVSDFAAVKAAIERIIRKTGNVDVLISNAGRHLSANIENTEEDVFDKLIDLNVKGAFAATQAVLPAMKHQGGAIIYIASDQALIAKHNSFAYNLSKHALASMAKTTALDYAQFNIRANALCPGTVETPLYHHAIDAYCQRSGADKNEIHAEEAALQPLGRLGQPDEVADFALFLASDKASFITGSLQVIDGGYTTQ
ncbi:SDR family NAD(P)-dependent oxidoreductase [Thalassotalea sp. PS06]|uniref:SDR family NAD(P)-dependent oxidoreductase n=1 Tax=Thalassotalea sp. PS06 TaxID=2594005 RepID=UPI0011632975|nr:SDR family oxidoreductase [Thalassotalea sp. PS06]QDP02360.1 SDR family oxidoreductase [Thalassotalea sp. PS06]